MYIYMYACIDIIYICRHMRIYLPLHPQLIEDTPSSSPPTPMYPDILASQSNTMKHTHTPYNALQHSGTLGVTNCNTLQHTVTHCNTLQHTVTHCNKLQHTITPFNTLQHTATHRRALQHTKMLGVTNYETATHCNALQHTATHCNTLQHTAIH